jgi:tungstate transport system substrate-binding protein
MIRVFALILSIVVVSTAEAQDRFITLSSTTSTQDSGLFSYILPLFTAETGIAVHVVAVGTGQALAIGERGDAEVAESENQRRANLARMAHQQVRS